MSWANRRGVQTNNSIPTNQPQQNPVQMYNPNQHSNQETNWQQDANWFKTYNYPSQPEQQQQQPQQQQQQQQQQLQQNYWQPYSQQGGQNYTQNPQQQYQQLSNQPPTHPVQNPTYYHNASYQADNNRQYETQNALYTQQQTESGDKWNWGWGDEDNSNIQTQGNTGNVNLNQQTIADSFANDESWNWSIDESNSTTTTSMANPKTEALSNMPSQDTDKSYGSEETFPKMGKLSEKYSKSHTEDLDNALRKEKPDNLTPQWSTESQMSQESSDDVLNTSDCEKMLSRSSTISHSSTPATEAYPEMQAVMTEPTDTRTYYRQNPQSMETAGIQQQENVEVLKSSYGVKNHQPQKFNNQAPVSTPPLPRPNPTPSPALVTKNANTSAPPASKPNVPLTDFKNPYKRNTGMSHHKPTNQMKPVSQPETSSYYQNTTFGQPFAQFNLESLPDNSEQPDVMMPHHVHKINQNKSQQPDNNEVAPINDRNQYLETGQLSDESTNNLQLDTDTLPPPGLRRMVLGQMEQNESSIQNTSDEPPPGLSRMVLGQTETNSSSGNDNKTELDSQLLVGFQRMIPGESSPPEPSSQYQGNDRRETGYISESELSNPPATQQRSATIGADTPPAISSNTMSNQPPLSRSDSLVDHRMSHKVRETNLDGANSSDPTQSADTRRQSIEGQTHECDLSNLVTSIRDLAVGESPTDALSGNINQDNNLRSSRESESDSDRDSHRKNSRQKRSKEKEDGRDKYKRDKYDSYRDKKYEKRGYRDRRYDDDTEEYYSDRERDRRKQLRDKRDDYDRKYTSLKREKDRTEKKRRDNNRRDYYNRYEDYEDDPTKSRPSSRSDSYHESYRERARDRDHIRRERDRAHYKRSREPYGPYMQGYPYDPYNSYYHQYQQYQYYENLRRTNPQAYAEWYRKYYQQGNQQNATFGPDDRASVHSGRSSANEEINKDRYTRQSYYSQSSLPHLAGYYRDSHSITGHYGHEETSYTRPFDRTDSSLIYEDHHTLTSQRLTPAKFATAHVKVSISSGKLIKILPNYPLDGQVASVEIHNLNDYFNDDEFIELNEFPGPLIKGVTHKKTIIEYCENKIRNVTYNDQIVDVDSYILMWELLILLIRQNGMVVGTDIAELLMKNRKCGGIPRPMSVSSVNSDAGIDDNNPSDASNIPISEVSNSSNTNLKNEVVTNKFRDFLIYGSVKEALEWAIKHGLWGHALFLASKLDKRTYANVMMRFANGLAMNDPLQTLYQLLSGKLPASVTCVADDKWGDWRPHLAMILSNASQRPELERKSITTLGDTLFNRGSIYAAQFCYLMAQVGFGKYGNDDSKLVLLGSNHTKPFTHFATNEAIHMTEIYEYACRLNDVQFAIPEFQAYKYLLATRLSDRGLLEKSLSYLEQISATIVQNPSAIAPTFVDKVWELADKLKYYDPVGDADDGHVGDGDLDRSRIESSWLSELKKIQNDFNMGLITHSSMQNLLNTDTPELDPYLQQQQQQQQPPVYDIPSQEWQYHQTAEQQQQQQQQQWQREHFDQNQQHALQETNQLPEAVQYQEQPNQWNTQYVQQQQPQQWIDHNEQAQQINQFVQENDQQQQQQQQQSNNDYWNNAHSEQDEVDKNTSTEEPQQQQQLQSLPQISMPNQSKRRNDNDDDNLKKNDSPIKQQVPPKKEKAATTGWFGGIWNKLALRPKNQMKLPDDKNPTIVWDAEKKRWINLEEENHESSNEIKPPPKMSEMFGSMQNMQQLPINDTTQHMINNSANLPQVNNNNSNDNDNATVPIMQKGATTNNDVTITQRPQSNMFKLQKQRNLKKSYVDIFNPGGTTKPSSTVNNQQSFESFNEPNNAGSISQMNFFIPQPVSDPNAPIDFLTPGATINPTQMSRWSSTSSLSREVQYYMKRQDVMH